MITNQQAVARTLVAYVLVKRGDVGTLPNVPRVRIPIPNPVYALR